MAASSGRKGRPWERVREQVFTACGDICHICGHGGAGDIDHVIPRSLLVQLGGDPEDLTNLRPAHGTRSPCPTCGRKCNREKSDKLHIPRQVTSRQW